MDYNLSESSASFSFCLPAGQWTLIEKVVRLKVEFVSILF